MAIVSQGTEGVDFLAAYAAVVNSSGTLLDPTVPAHPHKYGTVVTATDGSVWVFARVASTVTAIAQYDCVMIDMVNANAAFPAIGGAAAGGTSRRVGWYQGSTTLGPLAAAWFMISGAPRLRVDASCNPATQLYTTNTSGVLDDAVATGSQYPVRNVFIASAAGTSLTNVQGYATFPVFGPMTSTS